MTKKDYIKLARALKDAKPQTTGDKNLDYMLLKHWNVTCEHVAFELSQDNPRFNRYQFMKACTYIE